MSRPIRILILGTGDMANAHATAYAEMPGVSVVGGVDVNPERLAAFQKRHGLERVFATVEEALDWGRFDAVSNVTPDRIHHATTMACLAAGKHVLCEKPLATNAADADEMAREAADRGVVNMVNLSYRRVPGLAAAHQLVVSGGIGEVRHFEASYLQSWLTQDAWGRWDENERWLWRLSTAHGSMGVLGDIGVHILDFATHAAGDLAVRDLSCRLTTFDKAPGGRIGDYVLDANDSFAMHLALENGALGVVHASRMSSGHLDDIFLRLFGTEGGIDLSFRNKVSVLRVSSGADMRTGTWTEVDTPVVPTNYQRFVAAIRGEGPAMPDFARGAMLQRVLDRAVDSDAAGGAKLTV